MKQSSHDPSPLVSRLGALADPARLRLLSLLSAEELGVGELAEIVQMPQSSVSRHLKALADSGWVVARSERTANLYRMAGDALTDGARGLWEVARREIEGWPALAQDRLRLERRLAARAAESSASAFFAGVAAEWETLRADLYGRRFTEAALGALLPRSLVVADLACGAGDVAVRLAPHVARVVAVDRSLEMLAAARKRTRGLPNVELREGDLAALPLESESCGAAVLLLALTHLPDVLSALSEMARILAPGGRAVVVDLLRHGREEFRLRMGQRRDGFTAAELAKLLKRAGLDDVTCAPLAPEAEAKGPALLLASGSKPGAPTKKGPKR